MLRKGLEGLCACALINALKHDLVLSDGKMSVNDLDAKLTIELVSAKNLGYLGHAVPHLGGDTEGVHI